MKNPNIQICDLIESKMNEIIDFKGVLLRVQELQHALFQRQQHTDFQKLNESISELTNSSNRLEKQTRWLIGITLVLGVAAFIDVLKLLG